MNRGEQFVYLMTLTIPRVDLFIRHQAFRSGKARQVMLIALRDLLDHIERYLSGISDFSSVRNFVFQYYEGEKDVKIDAYLQQIFPVLLPYLHYEEAMGDPDHDKRMRRLLNILQDSQSWITERVVFALEFDDIRELFEKHRKGLISTDVYHQQMSKLSPVEYNYRIIEEWAKRHSKRNDLAADLLT